MKWDWQRFNALFKVNKTLAFKYRKDTLWTEIPKEFREVEKAPTTEATKETLDTITPKVEESVVEELKTPIEVEYAEIDVLKAEYKEKFGKNPSSKMKLDSLQEKLKQD